MLVEIWLVFHVKAGPEIQYNEPEKIEVFREKTHQKILQKLVKLVDTKKYLVLISK